MVLLLLLCSIQLHAQVIPNHQLLTTVDGLSQGMVFDILQSKDGFIWVATKDGLNRYDGYRFEVFSPDPFNPFSIGGSEVLSLFEDSRGWIWIVMPGSLDVYDPVNSRFFHVTQNGETPFNVPTKMAETPDGVIWVTDSDRIWKISPQKDMLAEATKQYIANVEPAIKAIPMSNGSTSSGELLAISDLLYSHSKKLLLATSAGLYRLDFARERIVPEFVTPNLGINAMAESEAGELLLRANNGWILLAGGKTQYREDNGNWQSLPIFGKAGYFWIYHDASIQKWKLSAFFNKGEPELDIPHLDKSEGYGYKCFIKDKSGLIWVGTTGYGLIKFNLHGQKFKTILPGTGHRLLMEGPDGAIYTKWAPDKKFLTKTFDLSAPNTEVPINKFSGKKNLAFDAAGNIWSINKSMLLRMDAATKTKKSFPMEGVALLCNRNGKLISVNEKGLHQFDPNTERSQDFPFDKPQQRQSEDSHFLYEDSDGIIWIFGFDGLTKATPNSSGYRYVQYLNNPADHNSLAINIVLSVTDDPIEPQRYLWIGTKGGGLNRLDKKSGQFRHYKKPQGLPDNVVYGVLAEASGKPYIWLSTNQGICRFDVRAETTKNFTVADGLQDNEYNSPSYLKTRDGTLLFGGINGLTVFHPDGLRLNRNLPQTQIVSLHVNNSKFDISGRSSFTLPHDQNLLTFDFAALEFTNPTQNQYRYQLVGVDNDWIPLGNKNSIQFANLAPGTYTFKVQGSNNDGYWGEQAAELRFTIRPPWYASLWAYLLYLALGAAGVWWYYQYLLRQRLSEQEKLRLQELDDFKSRFFTNITHEFRTPLTVILGMSERVLNEELTSGPPRPIAQAVSLIKRSGENLLRLVNQILDLSKLETNALKMNYIQGDVLTFIRYIAESLHSLANAQNLMLRVESDQAKIVMDYDPERFLQIIHNLLSNAIKFTPSGGKVVLQANLEGQYFHIAVTDSGAGIPPDELPHVFDRFFQARNQAHAKAGGTGIGLSLTRELVKVMGGEISVESKLGLGSTFLVKLPMTNNCAFNEKAVPLDQVTPSQAFDSASPSEGLTPSMAPTTQTVLLIEDNPDVVEYLNICLKDQFQLDFAYNGQAGIDKALETVPDLILSDVMMPFKDGFEVLEALKNDERTSHIPIIILTAKADVESRLIGLRRGADAYLSKPFHQEELLATLENLLETRRRLQLKYQQNVFLAEVPKLPEADPEDSFLQKVRAVVEKNLSDADFEMPQLERALAMSRSQIFRKIKALTGKSPSLFIRSIRLHHGKQMLLNTTLTVSEIAYEVGFTSLNYFSDAFFEEFGERPMKLRGG